MFAAQVSSREQTSKNPFTRGEQARIALLRNQRLRRDLLHRRLLPPCWRVPLVLWPAGVLWVGWQALQPVALAAQAVAQTHAPETTHQLLPFVPDARTPAYGAVNELYGPSSGTFLPGGVGLPSHFRATILS